jgi:hypothetical protein
VAGVFIDNELHMNVYDIEVNFFIETDSIYEQNIALDRIKYLFIEKIENAIFINETESVIFEKISNLGLKCVQLPEDPYDQILGIALMAKIDSVIEDRLTVSDIRISSRMSDGVSYLHSMEESRGPLSEKGWWNDSSPNTSTKPTKNKKVVKLKEITTSWDDLLLGWQPPIKRPDSDVIMVDFDSKTDK